MRFVPAVKAGFCAVCILVVGVAMAGCGVMNGDRVVNPLEELGSVIGSRSGYPSDSAVLGYLQEKYHDTFSIKKRGRGASQSTLFCASSTFPTDEFHVNRSFGDDVSKTTDDYQLVLAYHDHFKKVESIVHAQLPDAHIEWRLYAYKDTVDSDYKVGDPFTVLDEKTKENNSGQTVPSTWLTNFILIKLPERVTTGNTAALQQKGQAIITQLQQEGLVSAWPLDNALFFSQAKDFENFEMGMGTGIPSVRWDDFELGKGVPHGDKLVVRFQDWPDQGRQE